MREGSNRWVTQARDEDNRIVFVIYHLSEAAACAWVHSFRHFYPWTFLVTAPQTFRTAVGGT